MLATLTALLPLIAPLLTAGLGVVLNWFSARQQLQSQVNNDVAAATQQAMLTSSTQAQTVQGQMNSVVVPVITDVASAQVAFGVKL